MEKNTFQRNQPKSLSERERYPRPLRGLLTLGRPKQDMTYAEWLEPARSYVPELIEMALDPDLDARDQTDRAVWAPIHALNILARLAPVEAVEPLLQVLEREDDWSADPFIDLCRAVGAPAVDPLNAYIHDPSRPSIARESAVNALGAIGQSDAALRDAIVAQLLALLDRPAPDTIEEENVNAMIVSQLLDLEARKAAPAILRAFDENRVSEVIVSRESVERAFDERANMTAAGAPKDALYLTLTCTACRRERQYVFKKAYLDLGTIKNSAKTKDSPLIVPERVVCPKCGAVDQYEMSALTQFAIMGKLMAPRTGQPDPLPRLEVVDFTTQRWGWLPPRAVLSRYEAELQSHPDDIELRMGYANVLRKLGYQERAIAEYEQVLLAEPEFGDALYALAQMKAEFDAIPAAIAAWETIERRFDTLILPPHERTLRREEIDSSLAELRAGRRPNYESRLIPDPTPQPSGAHSVSTDFPPAAPGQPVRPAAPAFGKVGRNEPCPCGSGKKYKQCHGRK